MTTETVPMTLLGEKNLKKELQQLETIKRPEVIAAIAEARAHGDLKENAEYQAAKEMQSFVESRILELKNKLACAKVIDVTKIPNKGFVIFGSTVHFINSETKEKTIYQIVGEDEADIKTKKISVTSPIARALIGKRLGDIVNVKTPGGEVELEILKIEYI